MPPTHSNIVVVNSNPDSNKLYQMILKSHYNLLFGTSAQDVFDILQKKTVKVIISDYLLIGCSVIDFFSSINNQYPEIQIILLTEKLSHQQITDAINRGGIFSYLTKPVEPQKLVVAVEKAIEKYDLQANNLSLLKSLKAKNEELNKTLSELKFEEEKFRNIYNSSPDPIIIINDAGQILDYNPLAKSIFFNDGNNLVNKFLFDFIHTPDKSTLRHYFDHVDEYKQKMIEVKMFSKPKENDELIDFELNSYPVNIKGNKALMISLRDLSVRKKMEMKVLNTIIQTEEKERKRFAQELHDGIGPLLSITKLYLNCFTRPDSKMDKGEIVIKMQETLEETISSLRFISNNISPNTLMGFGLQSAIKTFINRIANVSDIKFSYNINLSSRLVPEIEITVYRLICEFITNSIKHSGATLINIEINNTEDLIIICNDNGCGFDVNKVINENMGSGLLNMKSRVTSLGGNFKLQSSAENGSLLEVKFTQKKLENNENKAWPEQAIGDTGK